MVASVERELRFPLPFWTPYTPDLGCFVRQGHAFQPDYNYFLWLEPAPWELTPSGPVFLPHRPTSGSSAVKPPSTNAVP
jgi:hypothetical protein